MTQLYTLGYTSDCTIPENDPNLRTEIETILSSCQSNNGALSVTGVLIYSAGQFVQILEGEKSTLLSLYEKIAKDKRHTNLDTFLMEPIAERRFESWAMALAKFEKTRTPELEQLLPALSDINARNKAGASLLSFIAMLVK